jgi:pimeloyl-ACP methyl ester carboxylesterase
MPNSGYGAGRDNEYSSRLDYAIEKFATAYDGDLSDNPTTIFLFPGGMGSQLMRARTPYTSPAPFSYYMSWLAPNVVIGEAKNLAIEPDGVDHEQKYVVPDGGIDFDSLCFDLHPYGDFIAWCKNREKPIHLFVFGWDWRRGVQYSTDFFLDTFLPRFEAKFPKDARHPLNNFSLIGHSAGGMVVKVIANQTDNRYVQSMKKAITVASPFYGYGAQIHLFIMGHHTLNSTIGGAHAASTMAGIASSMPGGYEFVYLDGETYDNNKAAFADSKEEYPLLCYPSLDKKIPTERADPFNPIDAGDSVRYPLGYGFSKCLLTDGMTGSRKVSSALDGSVATKFYCIRGVQFKNGRKLNKTVIGQKWGRVPSTFSPDGPVRDPIDDINGFGDGVQPAWGARLLGLPDPKKQVITIVDDIEHMTMMNAPSVQTEIARLLGVASLAVVSKRKATEAPVASRKQLNEFLAGLHTKVMVKETPEEQRKALVEYLGKFKQRKLSGLLARAYIDVLKSPSQVAGPSAPPKRAKAAKKAAARAGRQRKAPR